MLVNVCVYRQFQDFQDVTGINFNDTTQGQGNSLAGAIKGITEDRANLIAGQFSELRLTAFDQLSRAKSQQNIFDNRNLRKHFNDVIAGFAEIERLITTAQANSQKTEGFFKLKNEFYFLKLIILDRIQSRKNLLHESRTAKRNNRNYR